MEVFMLPQQVGPISLQYNDALRNPGMPVFTPAAAQTRSLPSSIAAVAAPLISPGGKPAAPTSPPKPKYNKPLPPLPTAPKKPAAAESTSSTILLTGTQFEFKSLLNTLTRIQEAVEREAREAKTKQDRIKQEYAIRRQNYLSQGMVKQSLLKDTANVKWAKVELAKKRAKLEEFDYNRHIPKAKRELDLLALQGRRPGIPFEFKGDPQAHLVNMEYKLYMRARDHLIGEIEVAERELSYMKKIYEETKQYLDPKTKQSLDEKDRAQEAIEKGWQDYVENKPGARERLAAAIKKP